MRDLKTNIYMMEKEIMEKKTSDKNSAYEYELLK